jgi:hypothetical protein
VLGFIFSFFYCRYNPQWILAFSVILFHSALSSRCFLHRLTPIISKSSSTPAIHLFRGLPLVLVPIGFHCKYSLRCSLIIYPHHVTEPRYSSTLYKFYYICISRKTKIAMGRRCCPTHANIRRQ